MIEYFSKVNIAKRMDNRFGAYTILFLEPCQLEQLSHYFATIDA
jgi:hypothetical protein